MAPNVVLASPLLRMSGGFRMRTQSKLLIAAGVSLALAIGAVVGSLWDGPFSPAKVGTIGDWVGGLGSLAAAGTALYIADRSERVQRENRRRDRDDLSAERALRAIAACGFNFKTAHNVSDEKRVALKRELAIEARTVSDRVLGARMDLVALLLELSTNELLSAAADGPPPDVKQMAGASVQSLNAQLHAFRQRRPLPPWSWDGTKEVGAVITFPDHTGDVGMLFGPDIHEATRGPLKPDFLPPTTDD